VHVLSQAEADATSEPAAPPPMPEPGSPEVPRSSSVSSSQRPAPPPGHSSRVSRLHEPASAATAADDDGQQQSQPPLPPLGHSSQVAEVKDPSRTAVPSSSRGGFSLLRCGSQPVVRAAIAEGDTGTQLSKKELAKREKAAAKAKKKEAKQRKKDEAAALKKSAANVQLATTEMTDVPMKAEETATPTDSRMQLPDDLPDGWATEVSRSSGETYYGVHHSLLCMPQHDRLLGIFTDR
jgi:hypothetical protein